MNSNRIFAVLAAGMGLALAGACLAGAFGCVHVLENGLAGKQGASPALYGPPNSLGPPKAPDPASKWSPEEWSGLMYGGSAILVALVGHYSRKATWKPKARGT